MNCQRSREVFFDENNNVNMCANKGGGALYTVARYESIHAPMVTVTQIIVSIKNMTNNKKITIQITSTVSFVAL